MHCSMPSPFRLTNTKNAHLRDEDRVGDALRDGEDVLAVTQPELK